MTDKQRQTTGKRLKQYRLQAGLSQEGLAKKAGLSKNGYAKMERDISEPTSESIKKLSEALGLKASDILGY